VVVGAVEADGTAIIARTDTTAAAAEVVAVDAAEVVAVAEDAAVDADPMASKATGKGKIDRITNPAKTAIRCR
jgi:hypothetical protein